MRRMLFHRDFRAYTGGHGKVWDYFRHALALGWDARVHLTVGSLRDASNPWMSMPDRVDAEWRPDSADVIFLAGMDWQALPEEDQGRRTVVNLVSHVRHAVADPALRLRDFLRRPAHRICLSRPIAEAILATGEVNGPVSVVPAAIDLQVADTAPFEMRKQEVLILATKQRALGAELRDALGRLGIAARLVLEDVPIQDYFNAVAQARVVVCLPHATEGFYLPGLEAMGLGTPLVVPDCVGNREYAIDGGNCLMPAFDTEDLVDAVLALWSNTEAARRMVDAGKATAAAHTLERERNAFDSILRSLN